MNTIFAILLLISVSEAIPFGTDTENQQEEFESFLEDKTEIADPSRSDATDEFIAELFDTPYNDKMNDPGFDPDLTERGSDGIAYRDELNDPINGEEGEEGEAEDEEGDESGSGVNPKPSKPPKKIQFCRKCCKESEHPDPEVCMFICLKIQACPKPRPSGRGGRGGKGRSRDDPKSAHFIEDESAGRDLY